VNPWLERRVIAFAHQGGSFEGPSSTLFAIEHALAVGATAIELDVHATLDRHVVVSHDHTVDRTTNHQGDIALLPYGEVSAMDNAYWWIEGETATPGRDAGEYLLRGRRASDRRFAVSTLEEVATAFPGVLLNLDIKRTEPDIESYEKLLYDQLRYLEITDSVNDFELWRPRWRPPPPRRRQPPSTSLIVTTIPSFRRSALFRCPPSSARWTW
jgi:glycerophosphoryl diester phosphodiesterase